MQKEALYLVLAFILAIVGIYAPGSLDNSLRVNKEPQTVPYVDVNSYLGLWYEQAVIPYYFERDCTKTTAKYSLRSDGNIRVDNSCMRNGKAV